MSPLRGEAPSRRLLRLAGDGAAAMAAFTAAFLVRIHLPIPFTQGLLPSDRLLFLAREWPAVLAAQLVSLYVLGFYDPPRPRSRPEVARRLIGVVALQGLILMGYYFLANRTFPRSVLLLHVLFDFLLLLAFRLILDATERRRERRVALVGAGEAAHEIAEALRLHPWHGLRVVGFVPLPGEAAPAAADDPVLGPCLGTPEDLPALLAAGRIEDIILAGSGDSWQSRLIDSLAGARPDHTNVLLLPGPFESLIGRMRYRWVHDLPLVEVVRETEWRVNWPVKRLLDLVVGSLLLLAALPVLGACALAVRLTSPGPVLYRQTRVGRGRRPFTLWKLRTMRVDAESGESGEVLAQPGDPRLTPIGALLRRYRLDEIPQLWNVLRGSMSLVGPRPERPGFVQRYLEEVPGYAERFSLAPGLTGLAQVNGDYHSSPRNKLRYELAYLANWSLWLDVTILLRTVKIVLTSRGV
ncbi:MAG TPA: sugar transferase [Thermoanaerobaculia bacterium]|nr:sugar transferase [Thermoanaerobaculia bacterium]